MFLYRSNSDIISQLFRFVNNFFQLFYFCLSVLFSFLRFASGFFCVSVVSSAATCYIIPPPFSDVNTYFWNFSIFLYFMFYIYFLYISDYFICIPVWPVEMFYIIGRFSFFYVLLCASMCFCPLSFCINPYGFFGHFCLSLLSLSFFSVSGSHFTVTYLRNCFIESLQKSMFLRIHYSWYHI